MAREIVSMVRDARLRARVLRVAHAVRVKPLTGVVRILRAGTNSCLTTAWETLDAQCTSATAQERAMGTDCVTADFGSAMPWTSPGSPRFIVRELMMSGAPPATDILSDAMRTMCFSQRDPLSRSGTDTLSVANATAVGGELGGGFLFPIDVNPPRRSRPES